jgi:hypothetical protein
MSYVSMGTPIKLKFYIKVASIMVIIFAAGSNCLACTDQEI